MEPADPAGEDVFPGKITGLELGGCLVRAIIENHWRAHALATIAIHGGHVRSVDTVMGEALVEWFDAHRSHAFGDQVSQRIIDHGRSHTGAKSETVGQVGSGVKLAAADMDLTVGCLAEGHDAWIQT